TIATQSPEFGVAIAGDLDAGEKLMARMDAAMMMAFGIVLMLRHRHTCSRSLANVQRRAVTAEHLHRRPFRQNRDRGWRVRSEFLGRVNDLSINNRKYGL